MECFESLFAQIFAKHELLGGNRLTFNVPEPKTEPIFIQFSNSPLQINNLRFLCKIADGRIDTATRFAS